MLAPPSEVWILWVLGIFCWLIVLARIRRGQFSLPFGSLVLSILLCVGSKFVAYVHMRGNACES